MTARSTLYLPAVVLAGALSSACSVDLEAGVASASGRFERELMANGPVALDVRTGSGSIDIRRSTGTAVRVVGHIRANRGFWNSTSAEERVRLIEANPPVSQNGNSIVIGEFEDRDSPRNVSISYEITVPAATSVRSRTGSGSHRIESLDGRGGRVRQHPSWPYWRSGRGLDRLGIDRGDGCRWRTDGARRQRLDRGKWNRRRRAGEYRQRRREHRRQPDDRLDGANRIRQHRPAPA